MTSFQCQDVVYGYPSPSGTISALGGVSFSASGHEIVSVVGPSGCGKTTLLKLLAGLLEPTSGKIRFEPADNGGSPRNALVFQDHGLFPWINVTDNVGFALEMRRVPRGERRARARSFLERVGLAEFAGLFPHELSVGMRQRVGVARAFVSDVPLLLMDEPFGSLDAQTRLLLQEELLRIWSVDRKLVVFVTHDIEEAILLGDRVLIMSGRPGRILEEIPIPLGRPRALGAPDRPDVTEVKWHIWRLLENEARRHLSIPD